MSIGDQGGSVDRPKVINGFNSITEHGELDMVSEFRSFGDQRVVVADL